jgi:hypothetical protein
MPPNLPPLDPHRVAQTPRPLTWELYDIYLLLTVGRTDHSGDFTPGAGLSNAQALFILGASGSYGCFDLLKAIGGL